MKFEIVHREIASLKVWGLTTLVTFAATMLGAMARGFGWI